MDIKCFISLALMSALIGAQAPEENEKRNSKGVTEMSENNPAKLVDEFESAGEKDGNRNAKNVVEAEETGQTSTTGSTTVSTENEAKTEPKLEIKKNLFKLQKQAKKQEKTVETIIEDLNKTASETKAKASAKEAADKIVVVPLETDKVKEEISKKEDEIAEKITDVESKIDDVYDKVVDKEVLVYPETALKAEIESTTTAEEEAKPGRNWKLIIGIALGCAILVLIAIIFASLYYRYYVYEVN